MVMNNQDFTRWPPAEQEAETGPDYVALVIEWEDVADVDVAPVAQREQAARDLVKPDLFKKIALGAGALGALLVARWGIHRLRHA
jgi:hypothetical protein